MIKLNPEKTALLIIDIQEDFCSPDGLSAKNGRGMEVIKKLLPKLKSFHEQVELLGIKTIFTRFIRRSEHNTPSNLNILTAESNLSPVCVEGTKGSEIYYLTPNPSDVIIDKQYYDCFARTDLLKILKENTIENLLITGVRTDICVDTTAKRAFSEGFNTFIISDLVATTDQRMNVHDVLLSTFKSYHGFVVSSEEVLHLLNG